LWLDHEDFAESFRWVNLSFGILDGWLYEILDKNVGLYLGSGGTHFGQPISCFVVVADYVLEI
jgi:hypothetical protein